MASACTSYPIPHSNDTLFSKLNITAPEMSWYKSFDGKTTQALMIFLPAFESSKKYPLILNIHGGPHSAYGYVFDHEFQWMAAQTNLVLYPNPPVSAPHAQSI